MGDEAAHENQTTRPEQVADEEALRALRAASPELRKWWKGNNPSKWSGVEWGDGRVRGLGLRGCPLKELPAQVGLLTGLTSLDLEGCSQLTALPAELGRLTGLTYLDLRGCSQLTALPAELGLLVNLTTLDLRGCTQLTVLPAELGRLTGLTRLDLEDCKQLKALPAELGQLVNLTKLDLANCYQLTALPAELWLLTGLTIMPAGRYEAIHLIVEPRKDTPEQLHAFLRDTPLAVPAFFEHVLTDPVRRDWLGEAIKATPDLAHLTGPDGGRTVSVVTQEQLADEEALRALRAASPELQERWEGDDPSKWRGVKWGDGRVREMELYFCPLKELPAQVGLLTGLTKLDLYQCKQLKELPAELWQLTGLTTLKLFRCEQLTALPAELGLLTGLTTLHLHGCPLKELPAELGQLTALTTLKLAECGKLKELPVELGRLTGLTTLDLNNCDQLTALPAELGLLTGLTSLDLENCEQLTALPAELGQLLNLTSLDLEDCHQLTLLPGAPANAKETTNAPPTIAAYARLLIVEPREDTPEQLHAFLLATPLAVPPFFKIILTDADHAAWLGRAVAATPDLARLTDSDGRRAIDVAVPACKQRMQAALYLLARYDVDDGPLLHRSATSAVAAADDHADPKAINLGLRVALKAMQGVKQVRAELQGRAEGLEPEHVVAVRAVYADKGAVTADDEAWQQAQEAAAKLRIEAKIIPGLSGSIQAHLFSASKPQESDKPMAAKSSKQELKRQPSAILAAASSTYKFLVVMDYADRNLSHTIIHEHIAGEDFHSIRAIAADLARALAHLHSKGLIQGDHKPLNAVAFGGDWKLIDLDVSCKIGQPFGNKVPSSGYCPPEMARVLLKATDDQGKVDGAKLAEYVASEAYDLWSFGTVLYHLFFGKPLWKTNVNDNIDPEDLQTLAAGGEPLRKALNKALKKGELRKSPDDLKAAAALLRKLLEPDAKKRLAFFGDFDSPMEGVLEEPLFTGRVLDAATLEAMLDAKLDDLKANQEVMIAYQVEVMHRLDKIHQSLKTVDTRLMTLTKGDHQVRFRYFLLVPRPIDGIAKFNPKRLLEDSMLLIPLYMDEDNNLRKAPVNKEALGGHEGFEVSVPTAFVKAHPKLVMISLFVVKMALTAAAAQVGAKVGTLLTFDIDFSGGGSVSTMLEDVAKDTLNRAGAELLSVDTSGAVSGKVAEVINNLTTAPEAGLDELLKKKEEGATAPAGPGLTNDEYANLAKWLDDTNPGWQTNLGLETEPQDDGAIKIVPVKTMVPTTAVNTPAAAAPVVPVFTTTAVGNSPAAISSALGQVDDLLIEIERLKTEITQLKEKGGCCVFG